MLVNLSQCWPGGLSPASHQKSGCGMTGRQLHYVDNLILASPRSNLAAYPLTSTVTPRELPRRCIALIASDLLCQSRISEVDGVNSLRVDLSTQVIVSLPRIANSQ